MVARVGEGQKRGLSHHHHRTRPTVSGGRDRVKHNAGSTQAASQTSPSAAEKRTTSILDSVASNRTSLGTIVRIGT